MSDKGSICWNLSLWSGILNNRKLAFRMRNHLWLRASNLRWGAWWFINRFARNKLVLILVGWNHSGASSMLCSEVVAREIMIIWILSVSRDLSNLLYSTLHSHSTRWPLFFRVLDVFFIWNLGVKHFLWLFGFVVMYICLHLLIILLPIILTCICLN